MIKNKVVDRGELRDKLAGIKGKKSIVFTNGCFDIIHIGHATYLEEAKKLGEILVVALNSDASVARLKGADRPLVACGDRMRMVASLESVSYVTSFDEDDPAAIVSELNPDVIVKGGDWKESEIIGGSHVKKTGGRVVSLPFVEGFSTTDLIKKIKGLK